jgi:FkbM family methyltransferase
VSQPESSEASLPDHRAGVEGVAERVTSAGPHNEALLQKYIAEVATVGSSRVIPLSPHELLVRTIRGFYMVVPGWNIDVGPGIIRDGVIEPWTNEVLISLLKEGDSLVNVGANFGYYSVLGAQLVGRSGAVYAIEANPVVFPFLVKSSFWSGYPDVIRCFNCAASDATMQDKEISFLFDPQFIGGGNMFTNLPHCETELGDCLWSAANISQVLDSRRMFVATGIHTRVVTTCRTVDSTVPDDKKINAMLIDAEGSECYVIAGAKETIRRNPEMSLIVEFASSNYHHDASRRPAIDDMWTFLCDEMGYAVWRICPEGYPGLGAMPKLERMTRAEIYSAIHSDFLVTR